MEPVVIPLQPRGFGSTMRRDAWWAQPLVTFLVLGAFVVYATWAAFQGDHYEYGPYLSPFYSPLLFGDGSAQLVRAVGAPGWWPGACRSRAALLILWAPGGFRFTCYYYRGAYYKAFWADPPSCAVGEPRKGYRGENSFPLILQNVHRYFLYLALLVPDRAVARRLGGDVVHRRRPARRASASASARWCSRPTASLLSGYTLRLPLAAAPRRRTARSLLGRARRRRSCTTASCRFNCDHSRWAWASLFGVALADLYVRLCSMGVLTDWRIL